MSKFKNKNIIFIVLFLLAYYLGHTLWGFSIPCPIKQLTNFYCPGCGITRMLWAIFHLDFYQAFRYNPLVFLFLIGFSIGKLFELITHKKIILNSFMTYTLLIIAILFGILRNIPGWEFLQPTVI